MNTKITDFLNQTYLKRKSKNSHYSLRAFAKNLGISHGALSQILKGKRVLSFKSAIKILEALKVPKSKMNSLFLSLKDPSNYVNPHEDKDFVTLSEEELSKMFKWYFYALLSSLEVLSLKPQVRPLSQFLGVSESETRQALSILEKIGAVTEKNGSYTLTGKRYSTSNNIPNQALVKAHIEHMERAIHTLQISNKNSDYSGMTFAIPKSKIEDAQRRIKEFRRELGAWLTEDTHVKDDVYRLNIQLFPLRKIKNTKSKTSSTKF